jgi:lactoylglutathione lyase
MDVLHAAFWTVDIETIHQFYTEGLDLEVSKEFISTDGAHNRFFKGDGIGELQFKYTPKSQEQALEGFDHIGIEVEDLDAAVNHLTEQFGSEIKQGPHLLEDKNIYIVFLTDPEGNVIELIERI